MLHIIQFSGGVGSAYVAKLVIEKHGKENVILLYHDVKGGQHPDTYRFNDDVSNYLDVPIIEKSVNKSFWQVIEENKCLPSSFRPFCNRIFKLEQGEKFYSSINEQFIIYNGFDIFEYNRYVRAVENAKEKDRIVVSPLIDYLVPLGIFLTPKDIKREIENDWDIKLPETYKYFPHNNCIPCYKAGEKHWKAVYRHYPEQYWKAVEMEEKIGHTVFEKFSLRELAKIVERQNKNLSLFIA